MKMEIEHALVIYSYIYYIHHGEKEPNMAPSFYSSNIKEIQNLINLNLIGNGKKLRLRVD